MSGRHIQVDIAEAPDLAADVNLARMNIRERILRWLFGPINELMLIVPGRWVHDVTLTRRSTKPEVDETVLKASIDQPRRGQRFCIRSCRMSWWHAHPMMLERRAITTHTRVGCGATFESYGNKHRKY